jgi:hypothetical protein
MPETVIILSTHAVRLAVDLPGTARLEGTGRSLPYRVGGKHLLAEQIMGGKRRDVVGLIDSYVRVIADVGVVVRSTVGPIARVEICVGARFRRRGVVVDTGLPRPN